MKRILAYIFAILAICPAMKAADGDIVPYPVPPEDLTGLTERCDFIVSRFWNHCDFKGAMSKKEKLNNTFGDWIGLMPYASADTVHSAINRLLKDISKNGPQTLEFARMAEQWTYTDTSEIFSEEIYLPFAKAASAHKKISNADRARFQSQVQIIENTTLRQPVKHLDWVTPAGAKGSIDDVHSQVIVLLFNDHDCDDCALARLRLNADINATAMQKAGILTVVSIEPTEASEQWKEAAKSYPSEWVIGASEDADSWFRLAASPTIYLLDARHKVLAKDIKIDGLLAALRQVRQNAGI